MCVTAYGAVVCNMANLWLLSVLAASVYSAADNLKSILLQHMDQSSLLDNQPDRY